MMWRPTILKLGLILGVNVTERDLRHKFDNLWPFFSFENEEIVLLCLLFSYSGISFQTGVILTECQSLHQVLVVRLSITPCRLLYDPP